MKEPDRNIYTCNDRAEYVEILKQTSAMKHGNNPASNKPTSSKGYEYNVIIKPIWEALYGTLGRGLKLWSFLVHRCTGRQVMVAVSQQSCYEYWAEERTCQHLRRISEAKIND